MREADEEIREIKKEIIESRGLIIKTNNLVNSLAADVKSISKRQAGYERRFNWNSAVAYALFASLSFVGLKLASDARIGEIESEKNELERRLGEIEEELSTETQRAEQHGRAESEAFAYYELVRQQKRREVVDGYDRFREVPVTRAEAAFFRDTVARFRVDLSVSAYQEGLDLERTGRFAEAAEKLQESLDLADEGAHVPAVKYHLARALRRLGRQSEAIVLADAVVDQNIDRELQDDAMWLRAACAEELDRIDDARESLRSLMRRWPRSSLVPEARRHLSELNMRVLHGGAPTPAPGG